MFSINNILNTIFLIPGILLGFTFHEYAHAWVADRLGDKTPKFQGRLTLNPIAHIDPIGFLMILIVGIGWAKPVQTNPSAFKHYYKDDLKVSAAGVVGNLFVSLIFSVILALLMKFPFGNAKVLYILIGICQQAIKINCLLVIFNLLPLPGLDGFHILRDLFPKFFYKIADNIYRYQMLILIIFIWSPLSNLIIYPPTSLLVSFFNSIIKLIV
ncbi:site-2 protease family protein [Clostridium ganghwense]|uniref:Site-2 protease family protein n=1 Tax=Clostridium ganghwense TaxID=312089 RepID=A0ABT4CKT8_9CLOT|nr:site-2 protease family protein [Clostridium ganghwense]MCY6369652.1 site-2 protease family protein [Clostridium ganghwense]